MSKASNRFFTDTHDFKGEGILVKGQNRRPTAHLFKPDTIVKIPGLAGEIRIDRVLPIHEKVMYDYRGIVRIDGAEKYIYFNHDDIAVDEQ